MSYKELFRLTEGTVVSTFTSSNEAETYNGELYTPRVVGRSEISDTSQISKASLDVTFAIGDTLGQHLLNSSIDSVVRLDLFAKNEDDTVEAIFRGRIRTMAPSDKNNKATFESVFSSNRRMGARPVYQRTCRHAVYGPGCKLVLNDHKTNANVIAMSDDGLSLVLSISPATGLYNAGIIGMSDGTMRYITSQVGNTFVIIRASDTLNADFAPDNTAAVWVAPGCTQTEDICFTRFNNLDNFGGWSSIPLIDPISGTPIV